MIKRKASAVWEGDLENGKGRMELGSGAFTGSYSFASRFEKGPGTNPDELIAAAHAGCFSMALAHSLTEAGFMPESVSTSAQVSLVPVEDGFVISKIELETIARVPGIENHAFQGYAEKAKENCPVSKALAGPEITLKARLEK